MEEKTTNDVVTLAGDQGRLTTLEYIEAIFEDSLEFHGDHYSTDDLATVGGVAILQGKPVTVIGIQEGRNLPENIERNFGSPNPERHRRALHLMEQAGKFSHSVITFISTAGAYCGIGAGKRREGEAIIQSLLEMSDLKVPIISVIIGEGGSGSILTLAVTDEAWMLEHTIYAILSSEGFAPILWRDGSCAKEIAELMRVIATELKKSAIVDKVIPEVMNGQPLEQVRINRMLQRAFISKLTELAKLDTKTLLEKRYQHFRRY